MASIILLAVFAHARVAFHQPYFLPPLEPMKYRSRLPLWILVCAVLLASTAHATELEPAVSPSSAYAAFVLAEVAGASGVGDVPMIYRAHVAAAHAVFVDGRAAIVYNPGFLDDVVERAGTPWAAVSVIAHELGHHYYGHSHDAIDTLPVGARHSHELEADYFSGFALARMGASLHEAEAAQAALFSTDASPTHPNSASRLDAITEGWLEGNLGRAASFAPSSFPSGRW
jgi:hypothetical protein